jgi:cold shock CspA family protein/predicted RNA-binding Zn-ribbon protein involved in translation (DUF1610 family)
MRGTVKFYNPEKGFGFIFSEGLKEDIFFRIGEWKHPSVPSGNDDVEFELGEDQKGFRAKNIQLIFSAQDKRNKVHESKHKDDRITCPSCGRKVVPRMVTYRGEPDKTLCPYCGTVIKTFDNNDCFLVHIYGDRHHKHLNYIREFRDTQLMSNGIGKMTVKFYYWVSPFLIKAVPINRKVQYTF